MRGRAHHSHQQTIAVALAACGAVFWLALGAEPAWARGRAPLTPPPADPTLWYLTRGAAATAYLLLALSVALGSAMSLRAFEGIARAWRVRDLHQFISLLTVAFVGLHLLTLLLDPFKPFTPLQIVWPLAETYRPVWVALGVLGFYLLVAIVATSWLRRTLGKRWWHAIHLTSYAAFVALTLHGLLAGTDSRTPWMLGIYGGAGGAVLWLTIARLVLGRHLAPQPRPRERRGMEPAEPGPSRGAYGHQAGSSNRRPSHSTPPYI
jgi:sulfoxide reductase heme-binding subunit YedZ